MQKLLNFIPILLFFNHFFMSKSNYISNCESAINERGNLSYYYKDSTKYSYGDSIPIFKNLNFIEGDWEAFLVSYPDNYETKKISCLKLGNKLKLLEYQKLLKTKFVNGDISTLNAKLVLYQNDSLRFITEIIQEGDLAGFQNDLYGWTPCDSKILHDFLRNFK